MDKLKLNKKIYFHGVIILLCFLPASINAQQIAIKTNVIADIAMLPCIGTELVIGEKTSLNIELSGTVVKPWKMDLNTTIGSIQYRYWVSQRSMTQFFCGTGLKAGSYTYNNNKDIFGGDIAVLEILTGYAWPLSKRWNIEVIYGWGGLMQHMFQFPTNNKQEISTNLKYDIITTSLGINIVCILK